MFLRILTIVVILTQNAQGQSNIWDLETTLPGEAHCFLSHGHEVCLSDQNRKNIYNNQSPEDLANSVLSGAHYVQSYPVTTTRLRVPVATMKKFFESDTESPLRNLLFKAAKVFTQFNSFNDLFNYLGLNDSPKDQSEFGPNYIAHSLGQDEFKKMGVTVFEKNGHQNLSFSCATCHSSDLFGVKVIGLTNRFPRANKLFIDAKKAFTVATPGLIDRFMGGISEEDKKDLANAKNALRYIGLKEPQVLGLDTSLAQVGLSLAKRAEDEYATMIPFRFKRRNKLNRVPADSKPSVWWNLKYKTRWLSDGSIVSGNPVHTNFLWNELGRGADLKELEQWFKDNKKKVKDLTSYVFNTEAPKFNSFFPNRINIEKAKRGERLFLKSCKGCHGIYNKGWSSLDSDLKSYEENIATTKTWYHKKTPVIDVGTDPYRYQGMNYFYKDLNRLKISKTINTVVKPQKGYVPPPLVGIWSRWPYFHNNSAPTLYDVLTPDFKRPRNYIAVPAEDKNQDFDFEKNGYPIPSKIRKKYRRNKDYHFNTRKKGLSNKGHTKMMLTQDGKEKFSHEEKLELIEFLKTL